ncbi:E3 ubiquitin-protein ligase RNF123-like isoform X2 [Leptopilina boulardi]|uniref:E3 ubiquitin-protein ligase RNF123-like isoform X2 n=1 Tax=Leptopilina boulardi TaxID=63433 RepID=UPI0021F5AC9D|nr:E3 ubiquitin-protein ligase RNF123-like isoform X2 [Leptopilina boulardi]
MKPEEILENIFGKDCLDFSETLSTTKLKDSNATLSRSVQSVNLMEQYIKSTLSKKKVLENSKDTRIGRLGPDIVKFEVSSAPGLYHLSPDRLSVNSQGTFSTIRANVAVFKGKWIYELQLGTKGIMQVGWGTSKSKFNQVAGVGDDPCSYAYDGNRIKKWNVAPEKYGEPWLSGDIIGCALDMSIGTIDFYRNGRALGRAFENVTMGSGCAYFPTVSLALSENLTANFGATPLHYPVDGYETLEALPREQLDKATLLYKWFANLIEQIRQMKESPGKYFTGDNAMSVRAFLVCLARLILKHLGPLLKEPYVTVALFVPFVRRLCGIKKESALNLVKKKESGECELMICLDLLWTFLESQEIQACLESTVIYLLSEFRHVSLLLEYPDQCKSLALLTCFCRHARTRRHLLQNVLFDRVRFANFVHVKPLDEIGLAEVVSETWWETEPIDPHVEENNERYQRACELIESSVSEVEALQVELLVTLLDNSDGTEKLPTSRTIFLRKFRSFVHENLISIRTIPALKTPLPITLCCFHRLLVAFRILWDAEVGTNPVCIPCRTFYDGSVNYSGIDRLGGVISHLNKTYRNELVHLLGPEHEIVLGLEQSQETTSTFVGTSNRIADMPVIIPAVARIFNMGNSVVPLWERLGYFPYSREDRSPMRLGPANPALSLLELLDGIVLFFHVAAKKQIAKVASLRDSMDEYIKAMGEIKSRLKIVEKKADPESETVREQLLRTMEIFDTKLAEQARHMAWVRAAVYTKEKQLQLSWLLKSILLTLRTASEEGDMFSFVPDFYLEALADLSLGLRSHVHPTVPIEKIPQYREILRDVAQFLCDHFLDSRIVQANAKDTLVLTLASFVSKPLTLNAMESVAEESKMNVVASLLRPYENRAWAQSNWILVRFWQGNGFAFRYKVSPHMEHKVGPKIFPQESISQSIKPCPSSLFQKHVRDALLNNSQRSMQFINSLLNQLNWAFSEFIGMIQEIHNASLRPDTVFIESRQLKVGATCFELAISLLRVLEMFATIAKIVFTDNLLARLCQLLCNILNRVSSQTSSFQHVVLMAIPDLDKVDHFPILAVVIGILLALLEEEINDVSKNGEMSRITKTLLLEPSFQMSSLSYVLGESKTKNQKSKNVKPFSFADYKNDVTEEEITRVRLMIDYLDRVNRNLPETKLTSDDENTCTICYAFPIAAIFKPCNHQSCRACIDHHLLNSRECFFCKTNIEKVIDLEHIIIHDFTQNSIS